MFMFNATIKTAVSAWSNLKDQAIYCNLIWFTTSNKTVGMVRKCLSLLFVERYRMHELFSVNSSWWRKQLYCVPLLNYGLKHTTHNKYLYVYEERVYHLFTGHNTLCTEFLSLIRAYISHLIFVRLWLSLISKIFDSEELIKISLGAFFKLPWTLNLSRCVLSSQGESQVFLISE